MNYIREFLYRPRKSDKSSMARFFFADENLTAVANELDSFDGRKDPERCACLVNRLRSCQDKMLTICHKMLEELEPGAIRKSREFRAKYPDDILNDNLVGQLWFGAECLAAGSSIMNKESESESMRPLAKAVTKSLEKVRTLLREQCLSPQPVYTESIREHLKIFDRLFADFEFNYVRCMVHVKTVKEYQLHQDLIVLFSETLMHAIKEEFVTQEAVDYCDPSLMFAIPRLAIVYGLLVCNRDGPLNVDRSSSEFPMLFLPFKNLLRKIRELLYTLEANEVMVLQMLLCNLEEPASITSKLKEVQYMLEEREKTQEGKAQALKLQAKLTQPEDFPGPRSSSSSNILRRFNSIPCVCNDATAAGGDGDAATSSSIVSGIVESLIGDVVSAAVLKKHKEKVEIDCTGPNIEVRVSQRRRSLAKSMSKGDVDVPTPSLGLGYATSSSSGSNTTPLKRHNAQRDTKRIPLRYQKDRRAKFKSTEDLLRRLYVCISGAADQLQSNYAGDFRSILRTVFLMNSSPEDDNEEVDSPEEKPASVSASPPSVLPEHALQIDVGTDAIQHDQISQMYNSQLRGDGEEDEASANQGAVYAQNLDLIRQHESQEATIGENDGQQEFYQSEPTLLDIALGAADELVLSDSSPREVSVPESQFYDRSRVQSASGDEQRGQSYRTPPPWIPDEAVSACMGCGDSFHLIRRRHHCRACGKVFCGRCSGHSMSLPMFRLDRPVRVCNRCFLMLNPAPMIVEAGTSPEGDTAASSNPEGSTSPRQQIFYQQSFGIVS